MHTDIVRVFSRLFENTNNIRHYLPDVHIVRIRRTSTTIVMILRTARSRRRMRLGLIVLSADRIEIRANRPRLCVYQQFLYRVASSKRYLPSCSARNIFFFHDVMIATLVLYGDNRDTSRKNTKFFTDSFRVTFLFETIKKIITFITVIITLVITNSCHNKKCKMFTYFIIEPSNKSQTYKNGPPKGTSHPRRRSVQL